MAERRYSEEEVGAIFELATKAQAGGARQLPSGEGMTLAGLQEIGREVGIPPELVAQAASALDKQGENRTRRVMGLPIGVGKTVDLGRKLSDAEWEQLVVDLRQTFDATGYVKQDGNFRQWSNGALQVLVEPTPTGHQIRMRTTKTQAIGLLAGGGMVLGLSAVMRLVSLVSPRLGQPRQATAIVFMVVTGILVFTWGALPLPAWARLRRRQMDEIANRLTSGEK